MKGTVDQAVRFRNIMILLWSNFIICVKIMIIAHHFNIDNWFQMNHSYKNRIC